MGFAIEVPPSPTTARADGCKITTFSPFANTAFASTSPLASTTTDGLVASGLGVVVVVVIDM